MKDALSGHGLPPDAMARMIEAQAVWNETMGAKTAELAAESRVLVIAGQGHMLWRAGIPESAARRGAGPAAVVLPYPLDGQVLPIPDQLKRLRDASVGELPMAERFRSCPLKWPKPRASASCCCSLRPLPANSPKSWRR